MELPVVLAVLALLEVLAFLAPKVVVGLFLATAGLMAAGMGLALVRGRDDRGG